MRKFINLRMWKQLLITYLMLILVPYAVSLLLTGSSGRMLIGSARERATDALERMELRVKQLLTVAASISSGISYDQNLLEFVTTVYDDPFDRVKASWTSGDLSGYMVEHTYELDGLFLFTDTYDVLNTGYVKNATGEMKKTDWYRFAARNPFVPFWAYTESENFVRRGLKNLSLCRGVSKGGEFIGVLCVYISEQSLMNIAKQEDFTALICDPNRCVVAASGGAMAGRMLDELNFPAAIEDGFTDITFDGRASGLAARSFSVPGTRGDFRVIALYDNEQVLAPAHAAARLSYIMILCGAVISIAFILLFSSMMSRRIVKVSEAMHHVAGGDLEYRSLTDGKDEIGRLSSDLNIMLSSLRNLIQENYTIKLEKQQLENCQKDIQLQVLSSQINPHFLFNTLETIRMMAVLGDRGDVGEAIRKLSSLMRRSLYADDQLIPLSEELTRVEDYLGLQKLRLSDRFGYRITAPEDTGSAPVLPFLLQPLVENAVRHGLETQGEGEGYVIIDIERDNGELQINIADNGTGIPPDTLTQISAALKDDQDDGLKGHIGLLNVNRRLRLLYGCEYGLTVRSTYGQGTVVSLRVPVGGSEG